MPQATAGWVGQSAGKCKCMPTRGLVIAKAMRAFAFIVQILYYRMIVSEIRYRVSTKPDVSFAIML